jgi:hypothetical protein
LLRRCVNASLHWVHLGGGGGARACVGGAKKTEAALHNDAKNGIICKTRAWAPQQLRQPDEFVHLGRRLRCSPALGRAQGSELSGALGTRTRLPPIFKQLQKR